MAHVSFFRRQEATRQVFSSTGWSRAGLLEAAQKNGKTPNASWKHLLSYSQVGKSPGVGSGPMARIGGGGVNVPRKRYAQI